MAFSWVHNDDGSMAFYNNETGVQTFKLTDSDTVVLNNGTTETTFSIAELTVLDGVTEGTVTASKGVVVDSNKDIGDFRNLDATNFDAGASGTAGSLDIFPGTASKGKITISAADNTNDDTVTLTNAAFGQASTITLPDPGGASANLLLSEGAQTINGVQTFTSPNVYDHNTGITAFAGGGQASATALTGEWNNVTTVASDFDSVQLAAAVAGQTQTVKNSGANILSVFPASGDAINALAANLSIDIAPGGEVAFRAIDGTTFETNEVISLSAPTTQSGNFDIKASDNASNVAVTLTNASHGQATTVTIPDGGAATSFLAQSTAALTLAEVDVLDGATAGTQVASKAVIADANVNIGITKVTELHIGTSGSETQVTSTAAELNYNDIATLGTAEASKTLTVDANLDFTNVRNGTFTGTVDSATFASDSITLSNVKWVDVTVDAATLDGGGTDVVVTAGAGDQFKVRDIILVGGGTNFGSGGDRSIILTDGTTTYTTIANADIESAPADSLRWGNTKVPFSGGTSNTSTVAAANLRFTYSGGSTDHGGTGSIVFSVCVEKVA